MVVVGGGAWGLAVLKLLRDAGLAVVCVERGELCQNLRHYMHKMTMHYPTVRRFGSRLTFPSCSAQFLLNSTSLAAVYERLRGRPPAGEGLRSPSVSRGHDGEIIPLYIFPRHSGA